MFDRENCVGSISTECLGFGMRALRASWRKASHSKA